MSKPDGNKQFEENNNQMKTYLYIDKLKNVQSGFIFGDQSKNQVATATIDHRIALLLLNMLLQSYSIRDKLFIVTTNAHKFLRKKDRQCRRRSNGKGRKESSLFVFKTTYFTVETDVIITDKVLVELTIYFRTVLIKNAMSVCAGSTARSSIYALVAIFVAKSLSSST
ncbi:hypothetical protein V1477_014158 [Vespula maculifrons]|uniref:Uncharacterized protein n=1 Tax=Vespula maculifrons TaxID=7453 RepID=A0ABD2BK82_VESMC